MVNKRRLGASEDGRPCERATRPVCAWPLPPAAESFGKANCTAAATIRAATTVITAHAVRRPFLDRTLHDDHRRSARTAAQATTADSVPARTATSTAKRAGR